jgi:hypothetical protein
MKRPKQAPAVERYSRISASSVVVAGIRPSTIAGKTVGKQPSPACRLLGEYHCK